MTPDERTPRRAHEIPTDERRSRWRDPVWIVLAAAIVVAALAVLAVLTAPVAGAQGEPQGTVEAAASAPVFTIWDALETIAAVAIFGLGAALVLIVGGVVVFLAWDHREHLPAWRNEAAVRAEAADKAAREARAAAAATAAEKAQTERALRESQNAVAETDRVRLELAAALERSREDAARIEAKALATVRDAGAKVAADRIEAAALAVVEKASREAATATAEANRLSDVAAQAAAQADEERDARARVEVRLNEALDDLRRIRGCNHPETVPLYIRPTDPATGKRSMRTYGEACTSCHFLVSRTPEPNEAVAVVGVPTENGMPG